MINKFDLFKNKINILINSLSFEQYFKIYVRFNLN